MDNVEHPSHYTSGKIECIDAIESLLGVDGFKSYLRGNIIKYLWRMDKKGKSLEDAEKASVYLRRLIELERTGG